MSGQRRQAKTCVRCGRGMEWRKRWSKNWNEVKYCSGACARRGLRAIDKALEEAILALLNAREGGRSICPSEAARKVAAGKQWKGLMKDTRNAARRSRNSVRRCGSHRCHTIMNCAKACPKRLIPVKAIAGIKQEMARSSIERRHRRH